MVDPLVELTPSPSHEIPDSPRAPVQQPSGGPPDHRSMEGRLQHRTPTHEPRRAPTNSLCNPPQTGAYGEQILLMLEGTSGAGSPAAAISSDARASKVGKRLGSWDSTDAREKSYPQTH